MTVKTLLRVELASGTIYEKGKQPINMPPGSPVPDVILQKVWSNRMLKAPVQPIYRQAGFMYDSNNSVNIPTATSQDVELARVKTFTHKYEEKVRAGAVVMNPYFVDRITISREPGIKPPVTGPTEGHLGRVGDVQLMNLLGLTTVPSPWNGVPCVVEGSKFYAVTWRAVFITGQPEVVVSEGPSLEECIILSESPPYSGDTHVLATSALAECNKRSVDALTAMAEFPETVGEVFSILKAIALLLKDYKRNRDKVLADGAATLKRIRKAFTIRIKSLERAITSLSGSARRTARERAKLNREILRARRDLIRQLKRASIQTIDTLGTLWMTYRYSIMPNVYLVRDIGKALERLDWIRVSESAVDNEAFPVTPLAGYKHSGTRETRVTAVAQVSLKPGDSPLAQLARVASGNLLVTAWELVKLSWVVDWIFNVGDYLASISPPINQVSRGVCVAERYTGLITYVSNTSGSRTTIVRNSYNRTVMEPSFNGELSLSVYLDWKRKLDASVLIWTMFIKPLLRKH